MLIRYTSVSLKTDFGMWSPYTPLAGPLSIARKKYLLEYCDSYLWLPHFDNNPRAQWLTAQLLKDGNLECPVREARAAEPIKNFVNRVVGHGPRSEKDIIRIRWKRLWTLESEFCWSLGFKGSADSEEESQSSVQRMVQEQDFREDWERKGFGRLEPDQFSLLERRGRPGIMLET